MSGAKISSLNVAIRDTLPMLAQISQDNSDTELKVAALQFASGCDWMYPRPLPIEDFEWNDLDANGLTSLGAAYQELAKQLSQTSGFMHEANASCAPVMILFSDGVPTDDAKHGLEKLKDNNWFNAAIKIAVAIGDDANKDVLKEFVNNNSEAVLTVHNVADLKKIDLPSICDSIPSCFKGSVCRSRCTRIPPRRSYAGYQGRNQERLFT